MSYMDSKMIFILYLIEFFSKMSMSIIIAQ